MRFVLYCSWALSSFFLVVAMTGNVVAQQVLHDIPYATASQTRNVLDIYVPDGSEKAPVVFWIHGGGWQTGDKSEIGVKPKFFNDRGTILVSTNYRMLPDVDMETIFRDVAKSIGWVYKNIHNYGGDPERIWIMGHSAGAQLAALMCTDDRYLREEGVSFSAIRGCVPVDGDTYDLPAIIATAEFRQQLHGLPMPKYGHRVKFGNDPAKHIDYSVVTYVAKGKGIPPFLILYVAGHPDVAAQANRLANVLKEADVSVKALGIAETTHTKLNDDLGKLNDKATAGLIEFLKLIGD